MPMILDLQLEEETEEVEVLFPKEEVIQETSGAYFLQDLAPFLGKNLLLDRILDLHLLEEDHMDRIMDLFLEEDGLLRIMDLLPHLG